jgi:DNA/RNA-binding domain of Phe-tRNA-synthetase-like protein
MTEIRIQATERWHREHAGSVASVVGYRGVSSVPTTPALDAMKRDLEANLIARFGEASRSQMLEDPVLAAYERYDRRFGQSYHVAMQIRSIAQKGKTIPDRNAIVEAMFMTEAACGVLASAQDLGQIALPIVIDGTDGTERYTRYDGVEEHCKPGDQLMSDANGTILTSIAQGPTNAGLVTEATSAAVYCFYFVPGVPDEIRVAALAYLDQAVRAGSPTAERIGESTVHAAHS